MNETLIIAMLVLSGIIVGVINTLAGGGAFISMTLFTVIGLPINVSNGTNRIAVVLQNLTSSITFLRKRMLDIRSGIKLSIPAVIGNIAGSLVASQISDSIFKICMTIVLTVVLLYMIFDKSHKHPNIHGGHPLVVRWWHYLLFLFMGFYGGYIYVGLGYVILAATIWLMDLDIVTANVVKCFIIFVATPFSLIIFMVNGQVDYAYGLWHGLGNVVGAYLASRYVISWGVTFVRWATFVIIMICFADLVGLISMQDMLYAMLA